MIYLKTPYLNKLGYINKNYNDYVRMKQGLLPQSLASNCYTPNILNNMTVPVSSKYQCNSTNMYPVTLPDVDYGSSYPSNKCACTKYVQSA